MRAMNRDRAPFRGYDTGDLLTSKRLRSGETITYAYDALNRETVKTLPGGGASDDVFSTYDLLGRRLWARYDHASTGPGVQWTWDALGRNIFEYSSGRRVTYRYDLAGRRDRIIWPPEVGDFVQYAYDLSNRVTQVRENNASTGTGLLATYAYDNLGRRTSLVRSNGATTTWAYTPNSRDWSLSQNLAGTADDLTLSFVINPAGQVRQRTLSNTAYSYAQGETPRTSYSPDGLNRYAAITGMSPNLSRARRGKSGEREGPSGDHPRHWPGPGRQHTCPVRSGR